MQGLLHGALAVAGGRTRVGPRSGPLADLLICHGRIPAPGTVGGAAAAVRSAAGPSSVSTRSDLARVDPALLAAARRLAETRAGNQLPGGHGVAVLSGHLPAMVLAAAMPLAHALAAALTFWWARRGARLLGAASRLLGWRCRRLPVASGTWVLGGRRTAVPPQRREPVARPRLGMLRHAVARRGPPAVTA